MVSKLTSAEDPVELTCAVQNYDWGILGSQSLVGKIYEKNSGKTISEDKPYAEVNVKCHNTLTINSQLSCLSCGWELMLVDLQVSRTREISV